jgi:hypothetical protein
MIAAAAPAGLPAPVALRSGSANKLAPGGVFCLYRQRIADQGMGRLYYRRLAG